MPSRPPATTCCTSTCTSTTTPTTTPTAAAAKQPVHDARQGYIVVTITEIHDSQHDQDSQDIQDIQHAQQSSSIISSSSSQPSLLQERYDHHQSCLSSSSSSSPAPAASTGKGSLSSSTFVVASKEISIYPPPAPKSPRCCSFYKSGSFAALPWQYRALFCLIMLAIPAAILGAALSLAGCVSARYRGPIADVGYSSYQGNALNGVNEWLGIRYAAPPTKHNRFKAPNPPRRRVRLQQAKEWSAFCLPTPSTGKTVGADEDCLFLNIWAPADRSKSHPVYVFLQGGGLNSNASPRMNGTSLVEAGDHDIVVVTLNYRVGVFGFLASKEVKKDGNINAGNLDQRFALEWVQKHIGNFGGDNKRVTLGGASAGAASVNLHLAAYGGRDDGLFQAAIGHSNSFGYQMTIDESQYQYDSLVARAKCDQGDKKKDTLKCLRDLPINDLLKVNQQGPHPGQTKPPLFMYSNTIDGDFTAKYTYKAFNDNDFIKVPTIFGSDTNEGTIFTPPGINNYDDMNVFLKANYPKLTANHLDTIDRHYPKADKFPQKGDYWRTAANAYGEMRYNCPGYTLPKSYATRGFKDTWHYHYDVVKPELAAKGYGVIHCQDVDPIWGTATGLDRGQAPIISKYYASFIRTHDPNALKLNGAPEWTRFDADSGQRMHFVNDPTQNQMENTPKDMADQCNWFATIGIDIGM